MDDIIPAPPVTCIIYEGPEMSGRKLARVTAKGYGTLLSYAEADENATILERLKDSKTVGRQRNHMECRRDLFNKDAQITVQITRAAEAEKMSAHTKRRRICTEFSSTLVAVLQAHVPFNFYTRTFAFFAASPLISSETTLKLQERDTEFLTI